MTIDIRDVFICTSTNENYKDFKVFGSYAVETAHGDTFKFAGVDRTGNLLPENDYYVFGECELEVTFERPQPPF